MRPLFKTVIVVWSEYDPGERDMEIDDIARDAVDGQAYCSACETVRIEDPEKDEDWDGTEFFGEDEAE